MERPAGDSTHALRRSEERFHLLVESVVDYAIFMLDPTGRVETWNIGGERLKGYTEDEIVGQHFSAFYTEADREAGLPEELLAAAREHGHVKHSGWRVRQDGSLFWADVVITALWEEVGTLAGFAKVTRDMTEAHETEQARERAVAEQRLAVERLEELVRWRKDFIASVIHDLLTPVASVAGFAELLLEGEPSDAERREYLERILSNAQAQKALLDDLVTYAQLESGRLVLVPERLDLTRLVHDLIADMAPVVGDRHMEVATAGVELAADRLALQRILRNLLVNAAQHTREGAAISVRARGDDDAVVIEVEDEGSGIPADRLPHVFEPFERGRAGGSGLGLWIVKHHVELHGGEVSADTEVGTGTVFRLTLPRTLPTAEPS